MWNVKGENAGDHRRRGKKKRVEQGLEKVAGFKIQPHRGKGGGKMVGKGKEKTDISRKKSSAVQGRKKKPALYLYERGVPSFGQSLHAEKKGNSTEEENRRGG